MSQSSNVLIKVFKLCKLKKEVALLYHKHKREGLIEAACQSCIYQIFFDNLFLAFDKCLYQFSLRTTVGGNQNEMDDDVGLAGSMCLSGIDDI